MRRRFHRCGSSLILLLALLVLRGHVVAQDKPERPVPENYDQWKEALQAAAATAADSLETLPDFKVELLRSARPGEGSWIATAFDPQGRLTISREDKGLLRLIIPDIAIDPRYDVPHPPVPVEEAAPENAAPSADSGAKEQSKDQAPDASGEIVAKQIAEEFDPFFLRNVENTLLECRGLLYAYDSLYANANNSKGFYRLRDRNDDGTFEEVTLLKAVPGDVGHGRNDLTLGPDGSIYLINGNDVHLPDDYEIGRSPLRNYAVDNLLPCEWNKFLFNAGATVPGGHVIRTDADGKTWEMVAGGFRNSYGIAFNADGEMFTYDSDMEWDAGAPWYRPTRVHHIVSGADYGWRQGTGKWPAWQPESLPANLDIGLGSPTAVEFGTKSNFPEKYRDALYILEWAYGRIIAVHLTPSGASYKCTPEDFVRGRPLNVTDVTFGPDGNMYFITGGRKTQSGLYRVKYVGPTEIAPTESNAEAEAEAKAGAVARAERKRLEEFHGVVKDDAVDVAWPYLSSDDLWLRHAARVAIECQPVERWRDRALEEKKPTAALTAMIALARVGKKDVQEELLARLAEFPLKDLDPPHRIMALRAREVCLMRMGSPLATSWMRISKEVKGIYPSDDARVDRLSCELLAYLGTGQELIEKTVALLEGPRSETEKLWYLFTLRHVKPGWTKDTRKTYFTWLRKARGFEGAQYIPRFAHYIEEDALAALTPTERDEVTPILNQKIEEPVALDLGERKLVKEWKLIDLAFELEKVSKGRSFDNGKKMFAAARCNQCHRVSGEGRQIGPELTDVSKRFARRDVLISVLSPSKVIADKYQTTRFATFEGQVLSGLVVAEDATTLQISADPTKPDELITLKKADIESQSPSPISTMPEGLLNTLKLDEILDLLAYLEAGGKAESEHFRGAP